jgi:hypothetical protein
MSFADARVRAAADHSDRDWFVLVKCHDLFRPVENLGKTNGYDNVIANGRLICCQIVGVVITYCRLRVSISALLISP